MIREFRNVRVGGAPSDVHVRTDRVWKTDYHTILFCGVYVHPDGPVPGYWYFPAGETARTLLASLAAVQS